MGKQKHKKSKPEVAQDKSVAFQEDKREVDTQDKDECYPKKKKKSKSKKQEMNLETEQTDSNINKNVITDNDFKTESKKRKLENTETTVMMETPDNKALNVEGTSSNELPPAKKKKRKHKHRKSSDGSSLEVQSSGLIDSGNIVEEDSVKSKNDTGEFGDKTEKQKKKKKQKHDKHEQVQNLLSDVDSQVHEVDVIVEGKTKKKKKKKSKTKGTETSALVENRRAIDSESKDCLNGKSSPVFDKRADVAPDKGQWSTADMGDSDRQLKFFRLLGGFKNKTDSETVQSKFSLGKKSPFMNSYKSGGGNAMNRNQQDAYTSAMENQFERALTSNSNRGIGLGFEKPPEEGKKFHIDVQKSKSIKFDD